MLNLDLIISTSNLSCSSAKCCFLTLSVLYRFLLEQFRKRRLTYKRTSLELKKQTLQLIFPSNGFSKELRNNNDYVIFYFSFYEILVEHDHIRLKLHHIQLNDMTFDKRSNPKK